MRRTEVLCNIPHNTYIRHSNEKNWGICVIILDIVMRRTEVLCGILDIVMRRTEVLCGILDIVMMNWGIPVFSLLCIA